MRAFLAYLSKRAILFVVFLITVSMLHNEFLKNEISTAIEDDNCILLGDSHAAQLDFPYTHEISSAGTSLYLPYFFLRQYAHRLPKRKVICISLWHENINTSCEAESFGVFRGAKALKTYATSSTVFGFQHLQELPDIKSKMLYLISALGLHRSPLNNTGTCFEGNINRKFDFTYAEKPFNTESQVVNEINQMAAHHDINLLWIISPQIATTSNTIEKKNSIIDSLLAPNATRNIQILDLRQLNLPTSAFRDNHHINCNPRDTINKLFTQKLIEIR